MDSRAEAIKRLLEHGGVIAVVTIEPHRLGINNTRVQLVDAERMERIPSNTRYAFLTRFISHQHSTEYLKTFRRMNVPFSMEGTGQIKAVINEVFPEEHEPLGGVEEPTEYVTEPVVQSQQENQMVTTEKRGRVKNLVLAFPDKTAQELYDIAKRDGIKTTLNSIKQALLKYVGKKGIKKVSEEGEVVVKPKRKQDELDKIASDAHAAIDLLVEYVKRSRKMMEALRKIQEM
jgi:Fe2+ or Zn2+ uptake regulation protein